MKLRSILAVAAALCVLLVAAWLPELVARRQDASHMNQVMFETVEGIQLEFDQENTLTLRQTLAMMVHPQDRVSIPMELASRRQEKVEAIAANVVDRLFQAGLLFQDPKEYTLLYCHTELVYGTNNQNCIIWSIGIGMENGRQVLSVCVDDRTGTVCSMEFHSTETLYGRFQMPLILDQFVRQYLTGLGEEFVDVDVNALLKDPQSAQDGSYLATEMTWQEPLYGKCTITLFVNENGFYTYYFQ